MRPVDFDERSSASWASWVLDHGLPELPDHMVDGLAVPVTFWAGDRVGAVLFVQGCPHDQDCEAAAEHFTTNEVSFRRADAGWRPAGGSSGVDWPHQGLSRPDVPARHVQFEEPGEYRVDGPDGWACVSQTAIVGRAATWIELTEGDRLVRRPVNAPTGYVIVAAPGDGPATIRILDADESELGTCTVTPRHG